MTRPNFGDRFAESERGGAADDVPTPPTGIPIPNTDGAVTGPPADSSGQNLADVIHAEDVGTGAPAVFGATEPDSGADPGQWPTLRQRSAEHDESGMFGWLRRRSGDGNQP